MGDAFSSTFVGMVCVVRTRFKSLLVLLPLFVWGGATSAQGVVQSRGTAGNAPGAVGAPAQHGAEVAPSGAGEQWLSPTVFLAAANAISLRAAAGGAGEIYDQVSPAMKARFSREAFVAELGTRLTGKVAERNWQNVSQFYVEKSKEKDNLASGEYISVRLLVSFRDDSSVSKYRSETISFHHVESGAWLLSGYQIDTYEMSKNK